MVTVWASCQVPLGLVAAFAALHAFKLLPSALTAVARARPALRPDAGLHPGRTRAVLSSLQLSVLPLWAASLHTLPLPLLILSRMGYGTAAAPILNWTISQRGFSIWSYREHCCPSDTLSTGSSRFCCQSSARAPLLACLTDWLPQSKLNNLHDARMWSPSLSEKAWQEFPQRKSPGH